MPRVWDVRDARGRLVSSWDGLVATVGPERAARLAERASAFRGVPFDLAGHATGARPQQAAGRGGTDPR